MEFTLDAGMWHGRETGLVYATSSFRSNLYSLLSNLTSMVLRTTTSWLSIVSNFCSQRHFNKKTLYPCYIPLTKSPVDWFAIQRFYFNFELNFTVRFNEESYFDKDCKSWTSYIGTNNKQVIDISTVPPWHWRHSHMIRMHWNSLKGERGMYC